MIVGWGLCTDRRAETFSAVHVTSEDEQCGALLCCVVRNDPLLPWTFVMRCTTKHVACLEVSNGFDSVFVGKNSSNLHPSASQETVPVTLGTGDLVRGFRSLPEAV